MMVLEQMFNRMMTLRGDASNKFEEILNIISDETVGVEE